MNKMFKLSGVAAALILSGMLVGCGSSSSGHEGNGTKPPNPDPDPDPKPTSKTADVTVIDGYVIGAKVQAIGANYVEVKPTGDNGKVTVKYKGDNPKFSSTDGTTASGLKAPARMISNKIKDGKVVINPFTTYEAGGNDVAALLGDLKLDAKYVDVAMGDYTQVKGAENADFAKAVVAYSRIMYCVGKPGNDNATDAANKAATIVKEGVGTDTATVLTSLGNNDEVKGQEAVKAVAEVNASTAAQGIDAVEKAVADKLGTGKDGCKASVTPPTPDTNGTELPHLG